MLFCIEGTFFYINPTVLFCGHFLYLLCTFHKILYFYIRCFGHGHALPTYWFKYIIHYIFIPVTRRVKRYTRFVRKYVIGRRKRFRPHKVYIFLIRITSRVDLAMSVCPSVRMNAEISETMRVTILGLGTQIPEIPAQRKFVSVECHAHSNAHKPPKTVASKVLMLE